ncbi:MAG: hypothetical protein PHS09_03845 [Candidatus Omnitrophica bacterium]|nr:hypothetical protein [Candidatus Omnitrophota bacterium]MDD5512676.1 hypothetical protein [Candidatus Omnitrophota bacterium]
MTKSRRSLRNSVRTALSLLALLPLFFGCSSSTSPTYLRENIPQAVKDICKNEYKVDVHVKLIGKTLWVYLPLENLFEENDKPQKNIERFKVEENRASFPDDGLKVRYKIIPVPEKDKYQQIKYEKDAAEKINSVWKVLRRVIFSAEDLKKNGPHFFCIVTADIKNGFVLRDTFYFQDLKKLSFYHIPVSEFQHRDIQDSAISADIIGDKNGDSLRYTDVNMKQFISWQIEQRIKFKFEKPEVGKNADIDSEIFKIIINTLRIYDYRDFSFIELDNLATKNRNLLNRQAVLESFKEWKF